MNIALWVVQVLLAAAFGAAGFSKLTMPIAELVEMVGPWATDVPALLVRFIGLSELLGAIGLILPALTRIQPRLTTLAAVGLGLVMILAAIFHATRGEFSGIAPNVVLLALTGFVAYGRANLAQILPRSS